MPVAAREAGERGCPQQLQVWGVSCGRVCVCGGGREKEQKDEWEERAEGEDRCQRSQGPGRRGSGRGSVRGEGIRPGGVGNGAMGSALERGRTQDRPATKKRGKGPGPNPRSAPKVKADSADPNQRLITALISSALLWSSALLRKTFLLLPADCVYGGKKTRGHREVRLG